jgi:hypothetical protein
MQSLCNQSLTRKMSWLVERVAEVMINAVISKPKKYSNCNRSAPPLTISILFQRDMSLKRGRDSNVK